MPLFNFSGVPYADVSAYFNVGVKWELPLPVRSASSVLQCQCLLIL